MSHRAPVGSHPEQSICRMSGKKIGNINLWLVNSKSGIIIEVNLFLMAVAQGGFGDYALVVLDFICY